MQIGLRKILHKPLNLYEISEIFRKMLWLGPGPDPRTCVGVEFACFLRERIGLDAFSSFCVGRNGNPGPKRSSRQETMQFRLFTSRIPSRLAGNPAEGT